MDGWMECDIGLYNLKLGILGGPVILLFYEIILHAMCSTVVFLSLHR